MFLRVRYKVMYIYYKFYFVFICVSIYALVDNIIWCVSSGFDSIVGMIYFYMVFIIFYGILMCNKEYILF